MTAPQREAVRGLAAGMRPWALRQARRTYGHLPFELHEQAVDQALLELAAGAGTADRRLLHESLARTLDDALRRVHVGWCLNQSRALFAGEAAPARRREADATLPLGDFLENGLGGLERAVLQLEIGAGRDSTVVRAALKLGPRQYARQRERGLVKLRGALAGLVAGRVCDDHLEAVALAATGDGSAEVGLAAGPGRCRACAREARALRRLLHERLALLPWPLAVKPAGLLAAKLGGLGALLGKHAGAGGAAAGTTGGGAVQVLAGVVAAAAIATGTAATAGQPDRSAAGPGAASTRQAPTDPASPEHPAGAARVARTEDPRPKRAADRRARRRTAAVAPQRAVPTAPAPAADGTPDRRQAPAIAPPGTPLEPVERVAERVRRTLPAPAELIRPLERVVPQAAERIALPDRQEATERVTGAVDGLLAP